LTEGTTKLRWAGWMAFAWILTATLAVGCGDEKLEAVLKALGEGCLIDSDCEGELVCVFRRCHVQCETTKDCIPHDDDTHCVLGDRPTNVCLLPDELYCGSGEPGAVVTYHADCLPGMYCGPDGLCRDSCTTASDCLSGQNCLKGVCADEDDAAKPEFVDTDLQEGGETCSYNSQCLSPLVCHAGLCAEECQGNVDCPDGETCVTVMVDGFDSPPHVCASPGGVLCEDGTLNGDESDVDCGGSCAPCPAGGVCNGATDCSNLICGDGTCDPASCSDGVSNGGEPGVDCGGPCDPCPAGGGCVYNSDCAAPLACKAGICSDQCITAVDCPAGNTCEPMSTMMGPVNVCVDQGGGPPAHCTSAAQDGDETDVDCGGSCGPCPDNGGCALTTDCQSGICDSGSCTPPSCTDGVANGDETSVDCGGATCPGCAPGTGCVYNSDCAAPLSCKAGICAPGCVTSGDCPAGQICLEVTQDVTAKTCLPSGTLPANCSDSTLNGDETDLDCGGSCSPCADGATCGAAADCQSAICSAMLCVAPTCSDGIQNGAETDTDCGGGCPNGCLITQTCNLPSDCGAPLTCTGGVCVEECQGDADCPTGERCISPQGTKLCAPPLPTGSSCQNPLDCSSGVCAMQQCAAPTCSDTVKNGTEINVDCGGSCAACGVGQTCTTNGQCSTMFCQNGLCTPPACGDAIKNGDETGVDCGGSCAPCSDGNPCFQPSDCTSLTCSGNQCVPASCSDGLLNGDEGGIDCGGSSCIPCGVGSSCNQGSDCQSGSCVGNVCQAPGCSDGILNGLELGIDCGSAACGMGCPAGTTCGSDADCTSGTGCKPGAPPTCTAQHALTIATAGTGAGIVTSTNLAALSTGCASCSVQAFDGDTVQLVGQANSGSTFMAWSGAGCSGSGMCSAFMSGPQTVTATFDAVQSTYPSYTWDSGGSGVAYSVLTSPTGEVVFVAESASIRSYGGPTLIPSAQDILVASYDPAAGWNTPAGYNWGRYDGGTGNQGARAAGLHNGVIMVLGITYSADPYFQGTLTCPADSYFTVRYDLASGTMVGSAICLGGAGVTLTVKDHVTDASGALWVVGQATGTGSLAGATVSTLGPDAFLLKLDVATGMMLQQRHYPLVNQGSLTGIALTPTGAVLSGTTRTNLDVGGGVLLTNPPSGETGDFVAFEVDGTTLDAVWGYRGGSPNNNETGFGIGRFADGTFLLGARYEGQLDFGDGIQTPNAGGADVGLVHLDAAGNVLSPVQHFGSTADDVGEDLKVAATGTTAGSVYVWVRNWGTIDYGGGPISIGSSYFRQSSLGVFAWSVQPSGSGSTRDLFLDAISQELWVLGTGLNDWGLGTVNGNNGSFYSVRLVP
jgi:Dickkopf N-terminal cysteine-rich region